MALGWPAPCGLKPRIALAYEDVPNLAELSELLGVTEATVIDALWDDSYVPSVADLAAYNANLYLVANLGEHHTHIGFTPGRSIELWQSVLWSSAEMGGIALPVGTLEIRWVACPGSAGGDVLTSQPYDPATFTVEQAAQDVVGSDYERLLALRLYVHHYGA